MNKYFLLIILLIMHNNTCAYPRTSNLVTPVSYFVNHIKQLKSIKDYLHKYGKMSVVGTSGIGKTQITRIYAYEAQDSYNIIWFFDCNVDLNGEFLKLAKHLNQNAQANIPEDASVVKKELMNYLTHQDNWLLVFDNLKINDNKKVQELVEWEHNGNIIFCSQDKNALPHIIEMINFSKDDTITLAGNILENKDQHDIEFLVEAFSGYPILIVQGAQLLNQIKGLDKAEYKKKIYESQDKIKLNITLAMQQLKSSAKELLSKIALINNQSFSKDLLKILSEESKSLDDDIYQLSKFALITNTENKGNNPVFEMHDIIAQKILEITGNHGNQEYLENIIIKITSAIPKSVVKGHLFRNANTIMENLEIIGKNSLKYNVNAYKIMALNSHLIIQYVNSLNYYNAEKLADWLAEQDTKEQFSISLMNNDLKSQYGVYLELIGIYYAGRYADYKKAINYYTKAKEVLNTVDGYESLKFNILFQLLVANTALGEVQEAKNYIIKLEDMFNTNLVEQTDLSFIYAARAKLMLVQGDYSGAIKQVDNHILATINNGLKPDDLYLTTSYLIKAEILNSLAKYKESYNQAKQLYEMHRLVKKEDHLIFGRIYTLMANSELGQGEVNKAADSIVKAMAILITSDSKKTKETNLSKNPDLAASYVAQGDIYSALNRTQEAIKSYREAQEIYFYLYKNNISNIAKVSELYLKGAIISCKNKDLYHYKCFGEPQIKEFGKEHPNTITMFEYCKDYNMDLWQEEN